MHRCPHQHHVTRVQQGGLTTLDGEPGVALELPHHGDRNVPLNEALAALPSDSAQAADLWQRYLARWTPANTVRAALSLAAAAAFAAAVAAARG